ncbi:hypothetical protein IUQ79_20790 [Mycobacteroides abscessus subsp. bolletii]|uniref:hypothetical protein n=1 Tax=Mycobacteroides abscessus TaxID=36809 RepID=UPI0019D058A7|nr:hypothetical protein [Mycobacteroides abscessus]MBN7304337.1 hypothetical protein [Mycobacteroides abscessus subsp. bolletii]
MINPADFARALGGVPTLRGALCHGRHELFDAVDDTDEAIALCRRCPALEACATWLAELPPSRRPSGVVAGKVVTHVRDGARTMIAPSSGQRPPQAQTVHLMAWLVGELSGGPRPIADLMAAGRTEGATVARMRRAAGHLGVVTRRATKSTPATWALHESLQNRSRATETANREEFTA